MGIKEVQKCVTYFKDGPLSCIYIYIYIYTNVICNVGDVVEGVCKSGALSNALNINC